MGIIRSLWSAKKLAFNRDILHFSKLSSVTLKAFNLVPSFGSCLKETQEPSFFMQKPSIERPHGPHLDQTMQHPKWWQKDEKQNGKRYKRWSMMTD